MKLIVTAFRMFMFLSVLTGACYPLIVTAIAHGMFEAKAGGSFIDHRNQVVGSALVAQNFESEKYFWPRPSGSSFNPLPSSGVNQSQISAVLKTTFDERKLKLKAAHPDAGEPPQDLLFSSGSGLDPEISPAAARYQISRVARARSISVEQVASLVDKFSNKRQLGFLGEPRVNVLILNIALDEHQGGGP